MPSLFNPSTRDNDEQLINLDLEKLFHLINIWHESLRYIPPIPLISRQALADDRLGGYFLPAGTVIFTFANAIHRLSRYWGETANTFDPERGDKLLSTFARNSLMTFLQGPRDCVGRNFAERETKILLVCLLSRFRFERDEAVPKAPSWSHSKSRTAGLSLDMEFGVGNVKLEQRGAFTPKALRS